MKSPLCLRVLWLVAWSMLCFDLWTRAATLEWQPIPGAEYEVHWSDVPGVVPGNATVIATGTAAKAWVPDPPAGKSRFARVTAHYPENPMPLKYAAPSAEVSWPLVTFTFAIMTGSSLNNLSLASHAVVSFGSANHITVSVPATGTATFLHLRYVK